MEPAKVVTIEDDSANLQQQVDDLENDENNDELELQAVGEAKILQQTNEPTVSEDQYKNLQAAFTRTSQENSSNKEMIAQLQQQLTTMQNQQQVSAQQAAPDASSQVNFEDLDKSASEFTEMKPMVDHIKRLEQTIRNMQNQQKTTEKELVNTQQETTRQTQMTAQEIHNQRIVNAHPDAFTLSGSVDFRGWVARQPNYVQEVIRAGSADDIIQVMSSYKQTLKTGQQDDEQAGQNTEFKPTAVRTNSNTVINTDKTQKTFTRAGIEAMSEAEFLANEEAINAAMVAGLIR